MVKPLIPATIEAERSSETLFSPPGGDFDQNGCRAYQAFLRPSPLTVSGTVSQFSFDLKSTTFKMNLYGHQTNNKLSTTIFLPLLHYGSNPIVRVSNGDYNYEKTEQMLHWLHPEGEQEITIRADPNKVKDKSSGFWNSCIVS